MQKIIVVENIKTIREGIKIFINRFSNFQCTHSFGNFESLYNSFSELKPDILLIDQNLKGISILEEIKEIKKQNPEIIIIILTMNEEDDKIFYAMINGASAYINKNSPSLKLIKTLDDISNGKIIVNSLIARKTINFINEKKMLNNYSKSEIDLLNSIIEGNNITAIEKTLNVDTEEIKKMFNNIYKKIHTSNNFQFTEK